MLHAGRVGRTTRSSGFAGLDSAARITNRVDRALERLREYLVKRGITTAAAALGGALTVHAVESVPAGLEISLAAGSVAAAASGSSGLLSNFMLMTKTKIAIGTALMAGIVATPLIIQQHALAALFVARQRTLNALRAGNDSLRRQAELEQSAFVAAVRESPANSVAGLSKADEERTAAIALQNRAFAGATARRVQPGCPSPAASIPGGQTSVTCRGAVFAFSGNHWYSGLSPSR